MDELLHKVKKELREIGEKGITAANLEVAYKLADIAKDLGEIKEQERKEGGGEHGMKYYDDRERDNYPARDYGRRMYRGDDYGARRYYGHDKLAECLDRIANGMDMYARDKEHYHGSDQRVVEGLDMMMYGVYMFVESAMDFAETPEEKEVIHKHLHKIRSF